MTILIKPEEFYRDIICPTLQDMGMDSLAARRLLLMTAAHESGRFRHDRQYPAGPALSFYQIEPATLDDLYENWLAFRPKYKRLLDWCLPARAEEPLLDPVYATAAARMIYYRSPAPLPEADDLEGLAAYAKRYWNTDAGKATAGKYLKDYLATTDGGRAAWLS